MSVRSVSDFLCTDTARLILAVLLVVGTIGLLLLKEPVPDAVYGFDGLAIGFYFGGAVQTRLN